MAASLEGRAWRTTIWWTEGDARNKVAHNGHLCSKAMCLRYVEAVEVELRAWGILETPASTPHAVTTGQVPLADWDTTWDTGRQKQNEQRGPGSRGRVGRCCV